MVENKIENLKKRKEDVGKQAEILSSERRLSSIQADKVARLSPRAIIKNSLTQVFPSMDETQKNSLSKNILSLNSGVKVKVGDKEYKGDEFILMVAERIDQIDAGVSRQNEYHSVIDDAKDIVDSMANGFTEEELKTRNNFLEYTVQREAELITCLALYGASKSPKAKARIAEMQKRLLRIREGRSAVLHGTKAVADKAEEQIKKDKENGTYDPNKRFIPNVAEKATMVFISRALANYDKLTDNDKKRSGFFHGTIRDVEEKNSPEKCLIMVDNIIQRTSYLEEMASRKASVDHIARLSGVRGQVFGSEEKERKLVVSKDGYSKPLSTSRMRDLLSRYNQQRA